jgi:hypothetical protein
MAYPENPRSTAAAGSALARVRPRALLQCSGWHGPVALGSRTLAKAHLGAKVYYL